MPNLPIKHELPNGSEFKQTASGQYLLSPADGTEDAYLTPWQGAVLAVLIENRELLKELVRAMEGK